MKRIAILILAVAAVSLLEGCASATFSDRLNQTVDKYKARDASTLRVRGYPYYRFDLRLQSDLDDSLRLTDLGELQQEGGRVLDAARDLAVTATSNEIDRVAPEGIAALVTLQGESDSTAGIDEQRNMLKDRFVRDSRLALETDKSRLRSTSDVNAARQLLSSVAEGIEKTAGDRGKLKRALLTAPLFLPAAIGAELADAKATESLVEESFDNVFIYRPPHAAAARSAEELADADDEMLAEWFAPLFVQQHDTDAIYPASEDQFGLVGLKGTLDQIEVHIDVSKPTVYWAMQEAKIGKQKSVKSLFTRSIPGSMKAKSIPRKLRQLVYVAWYPSRPELKPDDSEAGLIDGVVIRVTLDRHNRPAVYEFVRSCGCYHMLYVAEFVEAAAKREFGEPLSGKKYVIQRAGSRRELFMPSLIADDGSHPTRPAVYVSGGYHLLMGVEAGGQWHGEGKVVSERTYQLKEYDTLTHLPLGDGVASMFGNDGLVHNAGRAEGWLLAPTGMRSAGQPRQLGTMKIRMDAYDYDDPYLLDRQLRFPADF